MTKSYLMFVLLRSTVSAGLILSSAELLSAQIIPDGTLGNERSRVRQDAVRGVEQDWIEGGARRGENLFHSFEQFNVRSGQQVYFTHPSGVENIFGRVTGFDASNIRGTLGVNGDANLLLLNPNGFIFGPNAQLDVSGSLTISTADRIAFGGGQFFSAFQPEEPPLLRVSVPSWLEYDPGVGRASRIESEATLTAGEDLILDAGFLDLSGRIRAGGELTLSALSTLQISDVPGLRFVATSGGNMVLRGESAINILATDSTAPPRFDSEGRLSLLSNGVVTTNAQFSSAGNFEVQMLTGEPGYWVNQQNAAVDVGGDYRVGNYRGPSLQITAGDDITYGKVVINGVGSETSENPVFALNAGGEIRGTGEIRSTRRLPGLIVSLVSEGDLEVRDITTRGGPISLVSRGGNISARHSALMAGSVARLNRFGFESVVEEYEGTALSLFAAEDIDLADSSLLTLSASERGERRDGGDISLLARSTIHLDNSGTFSISVSSSLSGSESQSGDGGDIIFTAGNNIRLNNSYSNSLSDSSSASESQSGDGGDIIFTAGNNIRLNNSYSEPGSFSFSGLDSGSESQSGDGGDIIFTARNNIHMDNSFSNSNSDSESFSDSDSESQSGDGGDIIFTAGNNIHMDNLHSFSNSDSISSSESQSEDGGDIIFTAGNNIHIDTSFFASGSGSDSVSKSQSGDGGDIVFTAGNNIHMDNSGSDSVSFSFSFSESQSGNGGDIVFTAGNNVHMDNSSSYSYSDSASQSGDGGDIVINAGHDIEANTRLSTFSYARDGRSGDGGDIALHARGDINGIPNEQTQGLELNSFAVGSTGSGRGGSVQLSAQGTISNIEILTLSSAAAAGNVQIRGDGSLALRQLNVSTSQQVRIPEPFSDQLITINLGDNVRSGEVNIRSEGQLSLIDSLIESNTLSPNRAGNVSLHTPERLTLRNTRILSNTDSSGNAGNIRLSAPTIRLDQRSTIAALSNASGDAGNIRILADSTFQAINSDITTEAQDSSGGNVHLQAGTIFLFRNSDITTNSRNEGGNVILSADSILAFEDSDILAFASQAGQGGTVDLDTAAFFGEDFTLASLEETRVNTLNNNDRVDVNATGQIPGTVTLPDVSTLQNGLTDLNAVPLNTDVLLAGSCVTRTANGSIYLITGSGGLPDRPGETPPSSYPTGTIRTISSEALTSDTDSWQPGEPVEEPQGLYQLADGRLILSQRCTFE